MRWLVPLATACSVGCTSLLLVPTNEDVASWSEHRTFAGDQVILFKLPPDPQVRIPPRRVARLAPTSRENQSIVDVNYGYGLPEPRIAELKVIMEVRPVDGGGMEPGWTAEQFAEFYWRRTLACEARISPHFPKFRPQVRSDLPRLGETTWYQLTYPDVVSGGRISGDIFLRPLSPTHVLAVSGLYYDYPFMSPEAIERRRALMRRIVSQVRVEPPFGFGPR